MDRYFGKWELLQTPTLIDRFNPKKLVIDNSSGMGTNLAQILAGYKKSFKYHLTATHAIERVASEATMLLTYLIGFELAQLDFT